MMDYKVFKKVVLERIGDLLPPIYAGCRPEIQVVRKINEQKDALVLNSDAKDRVFVTPTIYLDEVYEDFCKCQDLELVLYKMATVIMQYTGQFFPEEVGIDFCQKKDSIVMNLVNTARNKSLLDTVPHREVLDLAVIYRIIMRQGADGIDSVLVTNGLMKEMGLTLEEIHNIAYNNTMTIFSVEIVKMSDMFYVMTNNCNIHGATSMICREALAELASKIGESFYIIPTSIHEVLALPEKYGDIETLIAMLEEGNRVLIEDNEILSNSIYFYDFKSEILTKKASYINRWENMN